MYRSKIREILGEVGKLSKEINSMEDGSDLYDAGLTSLATVGIMLAIEDEFDIEFTDNMLSRKTFESILSLNEAVEELLN